MKIKHLAIALMVLTLTSHLTSAATTGELLQQGLYAEEVEGNIDSAIRIYSEVIKNKSAPPAHAAQALYRQGMCYLKIKDEAAARTVLEKLVAEYASQTELVDKARPVLEDLTDFDPAALMPPGTLAYLEFGSPGRQIETVLAMLKDTPFENPLAAMNGNNGRQKSPGDIMGALLNPSMMAEFKKIRSSAIGVTSIATAGQNHPQLIAVLYPGKSDALRGLILAGLGMAGTTGTPIEGLSVVNLPEDMAVAYDDKIVLMARPANQLQWCVKQYKHLSSEPTLASSNKSFARLNKNQRQKNVMTLWANVDEGYDQVLKMFPPGRVPAQLQSANAFADFRNIDDLIFTESIETTGIGMRLEFQFKDGHHCLAYDMIRTPNISKTVLEIVPAEAVAVASFSLNQPGIQTEQVRSQIQNLTGLDIGREIFANIEQVTIFALPTRVESTTTNAPFPECLRLAITSRNPEQTKQILSTLLATVNPAASPQNGRYKVGAAGGQDVYCQLDQINKTTLLSLHRGTSAIPIKNYKSITTSGPLQKAIGSLPPTASKLILVNAGGAIRLLGPIMTPKSLTETQLKDWNASLEQLAHAAEATALELRTDEQQNGFVANVNLSGIPPLNQILGPVTQLNQLKDQARAESATRKLQQQTPATILPASKAPVIDGSKDEGWNTAREYKLANSLETPATSADDLSACYRALWDENNLYVLVEVSDDTLMHDTTAEQWPHSDSVEIYLDADNSKSAEFGEHDYLFAFNWDKTTPTLKETKHDRTQDVQYTLVTTEKGYRIEAKFPWTTLGTKPSAGAKLGLEVQVNDNDDGGKRDTKLCWHDKNNSAWKNPQAFGTAELAGLIGWWKFDDAQGPTAKDSSGGNHNGTLVGNAKFGKGKVGGAIDLDGKGSFVRIADKSAFDFGSQASVACWVNFRSVQPIIPRSSPKGTRRGDSLRSKPSNACTLP
ncbi:MAG: sugar-binding protein [Verrucomicrobiota bacterium]